MTTQHTPSPEFLAAQRERIEGLAGVKAEAPPVKVDGSTATIRVYQSIDDWGEFWGLSAGELVVTLDELPDDVDTIELRINSRGGMVFEAVTIMNALRSHPAYVVAIVEGLAASAASVIACSADEVVMMPQSTMMLHAAHGVAIGNASDMREMADLLDSLTLNLAEVYAAKTGESADEWLDRLTGPDLFYSADEAVEAGLADRVQSETTTETEGDDAPKGEGKVSVSAGLDPSLTLALLEI